MIISLNAKQSAREQVEEALTEEIKRNFISLLKHGWEVYIAVFPVDGGVIIQIGNRAIGAVSGEEECFQTVFLFRDKEDIELALECGLIEYDGENRQFVSVIDRNPSAFKDYLNEHWTIHWEGLEQLAKDMWRKTLTDLRKEVEEKQYKINEITAFLEE